MRIHRWSSREGTRGIRAFVHVYDDRDHEVASARVEAYVASGARHTGLGVSTDDDTNGLQLFAGIGHVVNAWLTIGSPTLAGRIFRRWGKNLPDVNVATLRLHDRAIWWEVWHDKWSWSRGTPRWRQGSFRWWDFLVGRPVYSSEANGDPVVVGVPMPEGVYLAGVQLSEDTWKRPRWPWPQVRHGFDLKVLSRPTPDGPKIVLDDDGEPRPGYIPEPGKGENAWDCGPDGTFAMSGPGRTVEEAIGQVVASVLRQRKRHAGSHDYAEPIDGSG